LLFVLVVNTADVAIIPGSLRVLRQQLIISLTMHQSTMMTLLLNWC